eukprot:TRINITY_DN15012_c0_g1_i1.p1 TRINITY_DN15012_c0_g1~~TRINITY_DN15012_c0_g1_i1.p1  ORF type:complete len:79 (+),score=3.82 TRINITY_DN15012_c0_g1_i1:151-387(+)
MPHLLYQSHMLQRRSIHEAKLNKQNVQKTLLALSVTSPATWSSSSLVQCTAITLFTPAETNAFPTNSRVTRSDKHKFN